MRQHSTQIARGLVLSVALALEFAVPAPVQAGTPTLEYPIVFVTQVPPPGTFDSVGAVFNNHLPSMTSAPRGGGLWIRYPDGSLRNLTAAAGYGKYVGHLQSPGSSSQADFPYASDPQGVAGGIAVRDPDVHWSGERVVFSMVVGSPARYQTPTFRWQLFEISGLGPNDTPQITRVANQPPYNNVQPAYASDGRIIFASDRPQGGRDHLYPQLDEYESTPIVTGLFALTPETGKLEVLTHSPSGDFNPIIDSDGRIIFTRWDHLIRDQQADQDFFGSGTYYGTITYASEAADAPRRLMQPEDEVFPEPRRQDAIDYLFPGDTTTVPHAMNFFFPWQINQDGSEVLTLNHVGRHELLGFFERSRRDDPSIVEFNFQNPVRSNQHAMRDAFTHPQEHPTQSGSFYMVMASEFSTQAGGQVLRFESAGVEHSAAAFRVVEITPRSTFGFREEDAAERPGDSGRYRNPLPLLDGRVLVSHTSETRVDRNEGSSGSSELEGVSYPTRFPQTRYRYRLRLLEDAGNGFSQAGAFLTGAGLSATISYFGPDDLVRFEDVPLWEVDPVELRPRTPPPARPREPLESPEAGIFDELEVDPEDFRAWLVERNLAALIVRDATSRETADRQQPFRLRVPAGVQNPPAEEVPVGAQVYEVAFWQLFQGDALRGLGGAESPRAGRRLLAAPLHGVENPPSTAPAGAVTLHADGSAAVLVPAERALTSQLLAPDNQPVVRERIWFSAVAGEIRVCASCHGLNTVDQAGRGKPQNPPQALRELLQWWKARPEAARIFRNGFEAGAPASSHH